jgi:tetratricopeptide (TPR) repeat protein
MMRKSILLWALVILSLAAQGQEDSAQGGVPGSSMPTEIRVEIRTVDGRATDLRLEVELLQSNVPGPAVDTAYSDSTGRATLTARRGGYYKLRVSGIGIEESFSDDFRVYLGVPQYQSVAVRVKAQAEKTPPGGVVSGTHLRIPNRARKEHTKAVEAAREGKWERAVEHLQKAISNYPQYDAAYTLLGLIYSDRADSQRAREAFAKAAEINPQNALATRSLGRILLDDQKHAEAQVLLEHSLSVEANNPESLTLLAKLFLQSGRFPQALATARKVHLLPHQKFAASHLIAARALEQMNDPEGAAAEYELFRSESPAASAAEQVRSIARASTQPALPAPSNRDRPIAAPAVSTKPPAETHTAKLVLRRPDWAPPDIDQVIPPVLPSGDCPLAEVLEQTGKRAQELVLNLQSFAAKENIKYVEVEAKKSQEANVNYVAEIRELQPGVLTVEEYRDGSVALASLPTKVATKGAAAFALIFHPLYVNNFAMECEGLSHVKGKPAWQVRFAHQQGQPNTFYGYRVRDMWFPVRLKGRAWISADRYHVLRMETDIMEPVKEVELMWEHVAVDYREVDFPRRKVQLWLPEVATIHIDVRRRRYMHQHTFTNFELFWVDLEQNTKLPREQLEDATAPLPR